MAELASNGVTMLNNEKRLLQRIQEGETELFTQIADHYSRAIFTLVVRIVGSAEEAEELTQDIFMKAFENLEYFSYRSSFSTWLYRIAYNTALSFARRKRPTQIVINERTMATIGDEQIEQMEQSFDQETIDALKRSIEMLDADEKALITLFYYEERSIAECAEIMGQSLSNTKVRLHRTRKKLYILITEKRYEKEL